MRSPTRRVWYGFVVVALAWVIFVVYHFLAMVVGGLLAAALLVAICLPLAWIWWMHHRL